MTGTRLASGLRGEGAQGGLRLDRDDLGDRRRIVDEVASVAGADLDDAAGEAVDEPPPMVRRAAAMGAGRDAGIEPREARMPRVRRVHLSVT